MIIPLINPNKVLQFQMKPTESWTDGVIIYIYNKAPSNPPN
jgi:hypothetical protein